MSNEIEIQEIAANTDLPDSLFSPAFPAGTVFYDQQDRKHHQVAADGTEKLHTPKPKGLQGAVFTYHLLWITAVIVWLFAPASQPGRTWQPDAGEVANWR